MPKRKRTITLTYVLEDDDIEALAEIESCDGCGDMCGPCPDWGKIHDFLQDRVCAVESECWDQFCNQIKPVWENVRQVLERLARIT